MLNIEYLDGPGLHRWVRSAVSELTARRAEINALNVFPVPDADTGSNMAHTMESALTEIEKLDEHELSDVSKVSAAMATGSVRGARGNSGVVLSQVLRGLAQSAAQGRIDGLCIQRALAMGNKFVVRAIDQPVEGTVITVLRAASIAAQQAATNSLADVVYAATSAAQVALEKTPSQLAALREAGVVDAGAQGLVVLLENLLREVTSSPKIGEDPQEKSPDLCLAGKKLVHPETEVNTPPLGPDSVSLLGQLSHARFIGDHQPRQLVLSPYGQPEKLAELFSLPILGTEEPATVMVGASEVEAVKTEPQLRSAAVPQTRLEVMFFIEGADLEALRADLSPMGDSLIIAEMAEDSGTVHIHTNQAAEVITVAWGAGRISNLHIEVLPDATDPTTAHPLRQVTVLTPAGELADLYRDAGATVIIPVADEDVVVSVIAQAREQQANELVLFPNGQLSLYELASVEQSARAFEQNIAFVSTSGFLPTLHALRVAYELSWEQPVGVAAYLLTAAADEYQVTTITSEQSGFVARRCVDMVTVASTLVEAIANVIINMSAVFADRQEVLVAVAEQYVKSIDGDLAESLTALMDSSMAVGAAADSGGTNNFRDLVRLKVCIVEGEQFQWGKQNIVAEIGVK